MNYMVFQGAPPRIVMQLSTTSYMFWVPMFNCVKYLLPYASVPTQMRTRKTASSGGFSWKMLVLLIQSGVGAL